MSVHQFRLAGAFVALSALSLPALAADAPEAAPVSQNPEVRELLEYIRRLESRVGELEREREWPLDMVRGQSGSVLEDAVRSMNLSGHMEFMYSHNFRHGGDVPGRRGDTLGENQLRGSDSDGGTFSMQQVQLLVDKPLTNTGSAGFRVRVDYGRVAEFNDRDPVFDGFLGTTSALEVEEAYMNYRACTFWDWMPYFDLAVGQFYSPLGYERPENTDNWLVTRNFIHVFGTPQTHTGLRVTMPFSECLTGNFYLVNDWDNDVDLDHSKTVIANLVWDVMEGHTLTFNGSYGNDDDALGHTGNKQWLLEAIWEYRMSDATAFAVDGVWGESQEGRFGPLGTIESRSWRGISAYAKHHYTDRMWLAARADWYRDELLTGAAKRAYLLAGSVALGYELTEELTVALEFRHDHSSKGDLFLNREGNGDDEQDTLTASFVYRF